MNIIERFKQVHQGKYDYSKFVYTKMVDKSTIICPEHGEFLQSAHSHLKGRGCPECGKLSRASKRQDNIDTFIEKAKKVHGDKYDYSSVIYTKSTDKIEVICPEHGSFWVKAGCHINNGNGCPQCGRMKLHDRFAMSKDEFISKSREVHQDKYDYSKSIYVNNRTKVCIICPEHGEFWQTPDAHWRRQGCPECSRRLRGIQSHDIFQQEPVNHLDGCGCQECARELVISHQESEISSFIEANYQGVVLKNTRSVLGNGYELDLYLPSLKLAFEFDGLYWHNEIKKPDKKYHLNKTKLCEEKGIHLIHIFEDEWDYQRDIVESRILNLLGITPHRIFARKCEVREVQKKDSQLFLLENHLQGGCVDKYRYGLYYQGELVSLMTFGAKRKNLGSSSSEGSYELLRFCNKKGTTVVGGADKLFKHYIRTLKPSSTLSYADRRWSQGNLYQKLGFKLEHMSQPSYFYVIGNRRYNRFNFRKDALVREGYDSSKTEHQIMLERKIYRIYDCGCLVYSYEHKGIV